jgi:hypothetical protein
LDHLEGDGHQNPMVAVVVAMPVTVTMEVEMATHLQLTTGKQAFGMG